MLLVVKSICDDLLNEEFVSSAQITSGKGLLQILDNHAPISGTIRSGNIKYNKEDKEYSLEIKNDGVFFFENNKLTILF